MMLREFGAPKLPVEESKSPMYIYRANHGEELILCADLMGQGQATVSREIPDLPKSKSNRESRRADFYIRGVWTDRRSAR